MTTTGSTDDDQPDMRSAALAWHDAGFCVLPVRGDGSKAPAVAWKTYTSARPTRDQVIAWFEHGHPGLGVVCGEVSGHLEMLEIEGRAHDALTGLADLAHAAGLAELWQRLTGYTERSPSGGLHLYYRVSDAPALPNTRLARDPDGDVLIETRGEGGFSIVAPSHGPTHPTGKPWQPDGALVPARIASISAAERDELYRLARTFDQHPNPESAPPAARVQPPVDPAGMSPGDLSPGDDYEQHTDWADILTPHGWQQVYQRDGARYWRRPGKTTGISATTGHANDRDRLFVFSTSTPFEAHSPVTKFHAHAVLNHNGDHQAAARELRKRGYGAAAPQRPVLTVVPPPEPTRTPPSTSSEPGELADRFPLVNWPLVLSGQQPEAEWEIDDLVERGQLAALYSSPKAGKSLYLFEQAVRCSNTTGRRWLYLDAENTERDLRDRALAMGFTADDFGHVAYLSFPPLPDLDAHTGGSILAALAAHHQANVVVLDTVSRFVGGEENSADTWRNLYRHALMPLKRAGITVIRLDHSGKDQARGQRGSSAKDGDVDVVWRLEKRTETALSLRRERSRTGRGPDRIELSRDGQPLRHTRTDSADRFAAEVARVVATLDELGVADHSGRDKARAALRDSGTRCADRVLNAALKTRQARIHDPDSQPETEHAACVVVTPPRKAPDMCEPQTAHPDPSATHRPGTGPPSPTPASRRGLCAVPPTPLGGGTAQAPTPDQPDLPTGPDQPPTDAEPPCPDCGWPLSRWLGRRATEHAHCPSQQPAGA